MSFHLQCEGGIIKLRSQTMLAEALRHLLKTHDGKVQVDELPQLFQQEFGHLSIIKEDAKIHEWISGSGTILSNACQVVHLNNNQWLVWAPGAYNYPSRTIATMPVYSQPGLMAVPSTAASGSTILSPAGITNDNSHILNEHNSISSCSVIDRPIEVSPPPGKKVASGTKKKNMAIKFPSASTMKAKEDVVKEEDIPPLIDFSSD